MTKKSVIWIALVIIIIGVIFYGVWEYLSMQSEVSKINFWNTNTGKSVVSDLNNNNIDQAVSGAEKAVSENPKDQDALLLLATSYAEKGSLTFEESTYGQKAIDIANQILVLNPNNSDAYRIIGYAYEIMQNYPLAESNYQKAIQIQPKNIAAHSALGHAYELQSKDSLAIDSYKKALAQDPNFVPALLGMMRYAYNDNKLDDLTTYASKVISLSSDLSSKSDAEQMLGFVEQAKGNLDEASKHFDNAITFEPKSANLYVSRAYNNLTRMVESGNKFDSVLGNQIFSDADMTIKLNPNLTDGYLLWARLSPNLANSKDAQSHFYNQALQHVDTDITLSKAEKDSMKSLILSEMKTEGVKVVS